MNTCVLGVRKGVLQRTDYDVISNGMIRFRRYDQKEIYPPRFPRKRKRRPPQQSSVVFTVSYVQKSLTTDASFTYIA